MTYLLDTCCLSELTKPRPDPGVLDWLAGHGVPSAYVSVLTVGELQKGIERLPPGTRRDRLNEWLEGDFLTQFGERTLAVDLVTARTWGRLFGDADARGDRLPVLDSLIAATARVHGLVVVTRNVRDMERCGAEVVNPWSS